MPPENARPKKLEKRILIKADGCGQRWWSKLFGKELNQIVWVIFDLTDINGVFVHFLEQRSL